MKKIQTAALILILLAVLSCSAKKSYSAGGVPKQNKVANIIEEKIKEESSSDNRQQNASSGNYDNYYSYGSGTENDSSQSTDSSYSNGEEQNSSGSAQTSSSSTYDYYGSSFEEISAPKTDVELDLSKMNADLAYAFIFQLVVEPEKYEGKTIRMTGTFETFYDNEPYGRHDYCIITDVLACCAQGLEFESAKVPGIEPGQKITISGTLKLRDAVSPDGMEYKTMRIAEANVAAL
ncbi:hypothetical protein [uncultured Treponema sp.]|uniref:hypothetical protein n=1 Tax=uncultured Treponema sp. TaxID=162155 RepID=UPI002600F1A7|nr:hypothetical protein [uncultured Treponema sp.]